MILTSKPSYTIQSFIDAVTLVNNKTLVTTGVYDVIAPILGCTSVKAHTLDFFLNGKTENILAGNGAFGSLGKTPRARLLKALRNRQTNGFVVTSL